MDRRERILLAAFRELGYAAEVGISLSGDGGPKMGMDVATHKVGPAIIRVLPLPDLPHFQHLVSQHRAVKPNEGKRW